MDRLIFGFWRPQRKYTNLQGIALYMNTNARGRPLARFLAKIVINELIFSSSPLCKGWHGFLPNQGNLDQKSGKKQPFVRGLASISQKFGNFDENVTRRAGLEN